MEYRQGVPKAFMKGAKDDFGKMPTSKVIQLQSRGPNAYALALCKDGSIWWVDLKKGMFAQIISPYPYS